MIVSAKVIGAGVSYETYSRQEPGVKRGDPHFIMSRGELMNLFFNPRRWLDGYKADEDDDTPATKWGSLIECMVGLNGEFKERYAVTPATYKSKVMECPECGSITDSKSCRKCGVSRVEIEIEKPWNSSSEQCDQWEAEQGQRELIKSELHDKAELAVSALESDPDVSSLFLSSEKQVMVVGIAKVGDVEIPLRCLLDLVPARNHPEFGKSLADFKTARNGCPDIWGNVVADSGYDIQAALSMDLYCAATGEDRCEWIMPVQENVAPYHVVKPMPSLSVEFIAWGRLKYQSALAEYAHCLKTGVWPSYPTGDRMVLDSPPCQIIDPKSVYAYRV